MADEKRSIIANLFASFKNEMKKYSYKDLLTGSILERLMVGENLFFLFFIFGLIVLNMTNHYGVERLLKENDELQKELNNMEQEAITTASELMYISKRSQVKKRVDAMGIGLEPLSEPPRTFKLD